MTVAGLVLAAGAGTRFGEPKAPVVVDGERLVDRSVRVLRAGGCDPVIVVLGAWVGEVPDATVVVNDAWSEGMGRSLRVGLEACARTDAEAVVVTLVDLPGLTEEAVHRIAVADGSIVAAAYAGQRGHPVRFARALWPEVEASAEGDAGARAFLAGRTDLMLVEVGDVAAGTDLDTPPDAA